MLVLAEGEYKTDFAKLAAEMRSVAFLEKAAGRLWSNLFYFIKTIQL